MKASPPKKQASIESQLSLLTFVANIIPSILLVVCLWLFDVSINLLGIVVFFLVLLSIYCVSSVWQKSQFHFRSLHNLLDSLVQGDYSFRGQGQSSGGAFGDLIKTINALASTLQKQRLLSEESQLLLRKIVDQIDVAIISWDQNERIQSINPAASQLLGISEKNAISQLLPQALSFANKIEVGETQVKDLLIANNRGKFSLHKESFITEGNTHSLLFMTNVSNILRRQEKQAWQNLIRVLSHEINNSLAPLSSISSTLKKQVILREQDPELAKELNDGISIIGNRAEALAEFVQNYHKISKLPEPKKKPHEINQILKNLIKLFPDEDIKVAGEPIKFSFDATQIEQVLINLIKNAAEANTDFAETNMKPKEPILIHLESTSNRVVIQITDAGAGIKSTENLFTPFYTTKKKGSGVGLVLCQQIIEAHGGYLFIANRDDQQGCLATIELPFSDDN